MNGNATRVLGALHARLADLRLAGADTVALGRYVDALYFRAARNLPIDIAARRAHRWADQIANKQNQEGNKQ